MNDERTDEYTASRYTVETCASEVLALRLALSLIENGAEPVGVIAAVRRRDARCEEARRALRANKDLNRVLAVAKRTGIAFGRLEEIDRTNCGVTPGEARAILTAFAEEAEQCKTINTGAGNLEIMGLTGRPLALEEILEKFENLGEQG